MDVALLIWSLALTILVVVGIVWILDLQGRLRQLQERREEVLIEGEDASANAVLENLASRLSKTNARTERLVARAEQVDSTLAHAVQGMGLIRFSAFEDTGGDQSFALALVDGEGNGVVISALYGREATRIYAKPVKGWLSPRVLTKEEEQALAEARLVIIQES